MRSPRHGIEKNARIAILGVGALILVGATFGVVSGQMFSSPSALIAQAVAAVSGKPAVTISRSASTPTAAVSTGGIRTIAVFDVKAKNVSRAATIKGLTIDVALTGTSAQTLTLAQVSLLYSYCIGSGVSYGYGYKGRGCGSQRLEPVSVTRSGNSYTVTFATPLVVYPEQTLGTLTLSGHPAYRVGGEGVASIRASIKSGNAVGDRCSTVSYIKNGQKYGYQGKCVYSDSVVSSATGANIRVNRSYGYGYCFL